MEDFSLPSSRLVNDIGCKISGRLKAYTCTYPWYFIQETLPVTNDRWRCQGLVIYSACCQTLLNILVILYSWWWSLECSFSTNIKKFQSLTFKEAKFIRVHIAWICYACFGLIGKSRAPRHTGNLIFLFLFFFFFVLVFQRKLSFTKQSLQTDHFKQLLWTWPKPTARSSPLCQISSLSFVFSHSCLRLFL